MYKHIGRRTLGGEIVLNQYIYFQKSFSEGNVFECGITCFFLAFVTSRGTSKDLGKIGVLLFSLKLCIGLRLLGWLFFNSCFFGIGKPQIHTLRI